MPRHAFLLLVAAALLMAGCAAKNDPHAHESTSDGNVSVASSGANVTMPEGASNATGNATSSNGTDMPSDPANCMGGMDMPGCTSQQADNYYKKRKAEEAAKGPPPDRALTPLKIALSPKGDNQGGSSNFDDGTMTLFITIYLNDTGTGPYAAVGPSGQGDLSLLLKGPKSMSKTVALSGTGPSVGVDPAAPLSKKFTAQISMPETGVWSVTVNGQGQNARVELDMLERFTMDGM
jgi:hypothetical protein